LKKPANAEHGKISYENEPAGKETKAIDGKQVLSA
jgi:hypothetical protein